MPPQRLGKFKTIKIECRNGHEVARYRKPLAESGHRTHKLWLLPERIGRLATEPPILVENPQTRQEELRIPAQNTNVTCGAEGCDLEVGTIGMVKGTVALVLNERNLKPTKG